MLLFESIEWINKIAQNSRNFLCLLDRLFEKLIKTNWGPPDKAKFTLVIAIQKVVWSKTINWAQKMHTEPVDRLKNSFGWNSHNWGKKSARQKIEFHWLVNSENPLMIWLVFWPLLSLNIISCNSHAMLGTEIIECTLGKLIVHLSRLLHKKTQLPDIAFHIWYVGGVAILATFNRPMANKCN